MENLFVGVNYDIPSSYLIINSPEITGVRDDSSGATGSIGHSDTFFDEDMVEASRKIDELLNG
mgnify:CR=1 FL=1